MVKMSISVDEDVAQRVRVLAAERGVPVSTLVSESMEHAVRQAAMKEFLDDFEAEHGAFTDEELAQARRDLGW